MRIVEWGKAITNKEWKKAWEIATSFWNGSTSRQREVLFYMLLDINERLEKLEKVMEHAT